MKEGGEGRDRGRGRAGGRAREGETGARNPVPDRAFNTSLGPCVLLLYIASREYFET